MRKIVLALVVGLVFLTVSCQSNSKKKSTNPSSAPADTLSKLQFKELFSQSNGKVIHPKHLNLDITVNFDQREITGSATWRIHPDEGTAYAVLDTRQMTIDSVQFGDGTTASFTMGKTDSILGTPLKIKLKPDTRKIKVYYTTGPDAVALQWLKPAQTFGKEKPYLYTQDEPIFTRTWIPCFDGPAYRFTYEATVKVPRGLLALMSAENPQKINDSGVYHFEMPQPIPSYLMALAVGDIAFKSIDDRTGVYASPTILAEAYSELDSLGKMVDVAEKLYGPYRWGRYDVLIMPSSFPMGGMENPRLTFATPTILSGDKSLVNLIAHELAHSWSGNLVTNATWNDIWVNEGFTDFCERQIMKAMHGKEYAAMLWSLSKKILEESVHRIGKDNRHTWLKNDLSGENPNDGFTDIPYEKGSAFLLLIDRTVGHRRWHKFLRQYFDVHAFQPMTTEGFLAYLNKHLLDGHPDWKKEIDIDAWVYGPGIPDNYPKVKNPLFEKVDAQTKAFLNGEPAKDVKTQNWSTYEWLRFLHQLPDTLSKKKMKDLDDAFDLTDTGNSEIADLWFLQALKSDYTPAYPKMKAFLYVTGRVKFLNPLYRQMMKTEKGQKMAQAIYKIARPNYHPMAQHYVDRILAGKKVTF